MIENVLSAKQQDGNAFNAAANVAKEMLDDAGSAHLEKKGKQQVHNPLSPNSKAPEAASCRNNTKRSHNAEESTELKF